MTIRIGIDARWIFQERTGIGEYTCSLIKSLSQLDEENQYFLFFQSDNIRDTVWTELDLDTKKNFKAVMLTFGVFSLLGQLRLPFLLSQLDIDIFHSTNFMIPLCFVKAKIVATFHDLIPFLFPEFAPKSKKSRFYPIYRWLVKKIIRRADYIVVDSENSKRDLLSHFCLAKNKVGVVLFGVSDKFLQFSPLKKDDIRKRFSIGNDYFLYVGRYDPYKNIMGLLHAFVELRKSFALKCELVIVGPIDSRYTEVHQFVKMHDLETVVHITGFVQDDELVSLYQHALAVVLPSFYEGFGLPILEAFASRTPVIASQVASLPEIVGDSGILINPKEQVSIVLAMKKIVENKELRDDLIEKGQRRLEQFSWKRAAQDLTKLYQSIGIKM